MRYYTNVLLVSSEHRCMTQHLEKVICFYYRGLAAPSPRICGGHTAPYIL